MQRLKRELEGRKPLLGEVEAESKASGSMMGEEEAATGRGNQESGMDKDDRSTATNVQKDGQINSERIRSVGCSVGVKS